jgi:hypothetical protein
VRVSGGERHHIYCLSVTGKASGNHHDSHPSQFPDQGAQAGSIMLRKGLMRMQIAAALAGKRPSAPEAFYGPGVGEADVRGSRELEWNAHHDQRPCFSSELVTAFPRHPHLCIPELLHPASARTQFAFCQLPFAMALLLVFPTVFRVPSASAPCSAPGSARRTHEHTILEASHPRSDGAVAMLSPLTRRLPAAWYGHAQAGKASPCLSFSRPL